MPRGTITAIAAACLLPIGAGAPGGTIHGTVSVPNAEISGVVIYLVPLAAPRAPAPTPLTAAMDQHDLGFAPRVVTVTPGSTVTFSNSDLVMHNVFNPSRHGDSFDLGTWPPGEWRSYTFAKEGAYVILCRIHPEMAGYVVVVASPYRAVTNDRGQFRFDNVAPGSYRLRTWHRRLRMHEENVNVAEAGFVQIALSLSVGRPVDPKAIP